VTLFNQGPVPPPATPVKAGGFKTFQNTQRGSAGAGKESGAHTNDRCAQNAFLKRFKAEKLLNKRRWILEAGMMRREDVYLLAQLHFSKLGMSLKFALSIREVTDSENSPLIECMG